MNCKEVKNKLADYHQGKLLLQEFKEIADHVSSCDDCANRLDEIANQTTIVRYNKKKIVSIVGILIFVSAIIFTIMNSSFSSGEAFGERVNVSTASNGIKFTATHVAADDDFTIVYFEISHPNETYIITNLELINDSNWDPTGRFGYGQNIVYTSFDEGRTLGKIYLPPIMKTDDDVIFRISSMVEVGAGEITPNNWYTFINNSSIAGDWELTFPVKRYQAEVVELSDTLEVRDTTVQLKEVFFKPTATEITYEYKANKSNEHNRRIDASHVVVNGKRYEVSGNHQIESGNDRVLHTVFLDGMFFDKPDQLELYFGKLTQYIANQVKVDIDANQAPYTIEYMGEKITIQTHIVGERTQMVINEPITNDGRSYNELRIDPNFYRHTEGQLNIVEHSIDGVWLDREGTLYKDLPDEEINLLYYTTNQYIEIEPLYIGEPFVPTFLFIEGYTVETLLDESISIKIK